MDRIILLIHVRARASSSAISIRIHYTNIFILAPIMKKLFNDFNRRLRSLKNKPVKYFSIGLSKRFSTQHVTPLTPPTPQADQTQLGKGEIRRQTIVWKKKDTLLVIMSQVREFNYIEEVEHSLSDGRRLAGTWFSSSQSSSQLHMKLIPFWESLFTNTSSMIPDFWFWLGAPGL